jgi:hypothetical protein
MRGIDAGRVVAQYIWDMPTPQEATAAQRSMRARIAALSLHASRDSRELTAPARQAFLVKKFEDEVDINRSLPEPERRRRADLARRAYFARLALRSSKVRAARKAGRR